MKKISKNLLFIPFFAIIFIFGNTSCKDDTDCKMEVIVKLFNDTNIVVPYAGITVTKNDLLVLGTTNAMGMYEYTFALEAIVDVIAIDSSIIDTTVTPHVRIIREGEGTVRLEEGKTVRKTILIK